GAHTKAIDVCSVSLFVGNRLVKECGRSPKELCIPCEPRTYTVKPKEFRCARCTQCIVQVEQCTATTDTKCGCMEGLICGDDRCSFCIDKCDRGQEPTKERSCRPCPDGTFNDKSHQMCKPWSIKCSKPYQNIVAKGTAFTDIKCANVSLSPVHPLILIFI
uniref:Tumor necrosis factor receptor superfamily, member 9a n=1 Tax=Dicentrarchus labrax TaxID=13489 RepID=A0A8C4GP69_DICLA